MMDDSNNVEIFSDLSFGAFIASLATSAFLQLGEGQTDEHVPPSINLPLAKQSIELIGMLREKTRGNLTVEEQKFMDEVLYELRFRYLKVSNAEKSIQ